MLAKRDQLENEAIKRLGVVSSKRLVDMIRTAGFVMLFRPSAFCTLITYGKGLSIEARVLSPVI